MMVHRPVTYLSGSTRSLTRSWLMLQQKAEDVDVDVSAEANYMNIYINCDGTPVEIHKEEGVYVPEMISGHLLTSSNYDVDVKKSTGGRNGYSAKLSNIFTEFIIETADGKRQNKYKQTCGVTVGNEHNLLICLMASHAQPSKFWMLHNERVLHLCCRQENLSEDLFF